MDPYDRYGLEAHPVPRLKPMTPMNPNTTHRLVYWPIFLSERAFPTGEVQFVVDPIHGSVDVRASCDWTHAITVNTKNYGTVNLTPNGKWMPKEAAREVWNALVEFGWRIPE